MKNKFTPDEQAVVDFLKSRPHSTATEIAAFTGLKKRGAVTRLLEDLDKKMFCDIQMTQKKDTT